jgi:putative acetyltransferase
LVIAEADPQSPDALDLLRLAAIEARALYPELHAPGDIWPTNDPTPPRGIYLIARADTMVVGMGAHRPLNAVISEVRRMYVHPDFRRNGVARAVIAKLETHALSQGFTHLRLETGNRQTAAMALYELCGYNRIAPFGIYIDDPTSVCYEKSLALR